MLTIASVVLSVALQSPAPNVPAPNLGDAYFNFLQGRMLEGRGDIAGAIAAYQRAAELEPTASSVHAELGALYARAGRAADALTEGETAIRLDSADREAHRILGLVKSALAENLSEGPRQTQLMNDAIGHLEKALAGARDPGAELTLGRLDIRTNKIPKAIETLKNFLYDNPGYPEGVMLLAEAYDTNGQTAEAIATLTPLATGTSAQTDAQTALASLYERADRWKDAAAIWGALAAKLPDLSYRVQQATALMNAGDVAAGRDLLSAQLKDKPRDASLWYLMAQAERRIGNARGAEEASRHISEIDPTDPRGPLAMAEAKEAAHDFAGVVAALQPLYDSRRAKPQPNDEVLSFAGLSLASAYRELKQYDRAEQMLRDVLGLDEKNDVAMNALGYLLADRGQKLDEAIALIKRALADDPANPSYLDSLGWAYLQQGKPTDALMPLEQAAKASTLSSMVQEHLGDAYFALKRYRDAADTYTRALAGDRDGIDAAAVTKKRDRAKDLAK